MSFRVYIGHSVAPTELGAIYGIAELAARKGMEPIVSDRHWRPREPPARVTQLLRGLDAFVVIATSSGEHLAWVNAELDVALRLGLDRQNVLSVVDEGVNAPPTGRVVTIDRGRLSQAVEQAVKMLEEVHLDRNQRNLLAGLILGGLAALFLTSRE